MDALTRHAEWKKRTRQEQLIERTQEFGAALGERLTLRKGRWGRIKMKLPSLLKDPEVIAIIQGTLDEERLLGGTLKRCMEQVLNRALTLERNPPVLQGGLMERDPRRH